MSREIRKEKDWWGDEKEVVYEDGHKVGEIRAEETLGGFGPTVKREYGNDGKRVSETRREETLGGFGPTVDRTYVDGKRISETRREKTLGGFGPTVERTYVDGKRISETRYVKTLGGLGPTVKREYLVRRPGPQTQQGSGATSSDSGGYASYSSESQVARRGRRVRWGAVAYLIASVCLCFGYFALLILNAYGIVDAYTLLGITREQDNFWTVASRLWGWTDNAAVRAIVIASFVLVLPGAFGVGIWLAVFCLVVAFPIALFGLAFQMMQVSVIAAAIIGLIALTLIFFILRWFIRLTLKHLREWILD